MRMNTGGYLLDMGFRIWNLISNLAFQPWHFQSCDLNFLVSDWRTYIHNSDGRARSVRRLEAFGGSQTKMEEEQLDVRRLCWRSCLQGPCAGKGRLVWMDTYTVRTHKWKKDAGAIVIQFEDVHVLFRPNLPWNSYLCFLIYEGNVSAIVFCLWSNGHLSICCHMTVSCSPISHQTYLPAIWFRNGPNNWNSRQLLQEMYGRTVLSVCRTHHTFCWWIQLSLCFWAYSSYLV